MSKPIVLLTLIVCVSWFINEIYRGLLGTNTKKEAGSESEVAAPSNDWLAIPVEEKPGPESIVLPKQDFVFAWIFGGLIGGVCTIALVWASRLLAALTFFYVGYRWAQFGKAPPYWEYGLWIFPIIATGMGFCIGYFFYGVYLSQQRKLRWSRATADKEAETHKCQPIKVRH